MRLAILLCVSLLAASPSTLSAQTETNVQELMRIAQESQARIDAGKNNAYFAILNSQDPVVQAMLADSTTQLMYVNTDGRPVWYGMDNKPAGIFLRTSEVHPGGAGGYNLSGALTTGQTLAMWDGDVPRSTHTEFGGRITLRDLTPVGYHSTQGAGTMIAAGIGAPVFPDRSKGMSFAAEVHAWNFDYDTCEMAAAAMAGTKISNHSYSERAGWTGLAPPHYWHGDITISAEEDYSFGYYDQKSHEWDDLAYNAPYMLIVTSAGNEFMYGNGIFPPDVEHKHYTVAGYVTATDSHPHDGAPTGGYDTIPSYSGAKNIITVGAVNDWAGNYSDPSDVSRGAGSSVGPTDDGRIKPDVVAPGVGVLTTNDGSDTDYVENANGTSIASPAVAGSANLIREHYEAKYGKSPWSSTLKALIIHTTEEAGPGPGPDYEFGWGLMNTRRAVDIVDAVDPAAGVGIGETVLLNGDTHYFYFSSELVTDFRVTIAWLDPPGQVVAPVVDDPTPKLINDLDLRIDYLSGTPTSHMPWVLDPMNYEDAATTGDNVLDNVEQVFVDDAPPGLYRVSVSHKNPLVDPPQAYAIVWSGMAPTQQAVDVHGSRFELFPGVLPDPTPPFNIAETGGEPRGVFITVFEDLFLRVVGIRGWVPCPSTYFVAIYEAGGIVVDPVTGGPERSSMPKPIATGSVVSYHPGWDYHYIDVDVDLKACQDYYVEFQQPQNQLAWPWYNEGLLGGPIDAGGAIRFRDGAIAQDPSNSAMPIVSFIADVQPKPNDIASDLEWPTTPWSTCADQSRERGLYVEPKKTIRVTSVGIEAASPGARFTAKIYEASGTTRGDLIAQGGRTIDNSGVEMQEVPIGATLYQGKQYNVVMEFEPTTWSCHSDVGLVPFDIDDTITVLDGEYLGNASNTLMPHMAMTWRDGAGGAPFDLAKQTDVFPPPFTETSALNNYGIYVKSAVAQELYSLGWHADVPAGKEITMRVYEATGTTRGPLLSKGTIVSVADGARWHDVPVSASLASSGEYDFEVEMEDVTSFGYWDDSTGMPYSTYGVFEVGTGESWGNPNDNKLIWMRANSCDEIATAVPGPPVVPPAFSLRAPYPNPATTSATIDFVLDEAAPVTVTVYDVRGRHVATLLDGESRPSGPGSLFFSTRDLPQGTYFVKLDTGLKSVSRKISVVR